MEASVDTRRVPLRVRLGSLSWIWQAISGLALVVLGGLHMTANHFVVAGGLRDFAEVQAYLRTPVVLVLEVSFLAMVILHAMLGVRAVIFDLGLSDEAEKRVTLALSVIGALTLGYGLWLTWVVINL